METPEPGVSLLFPPVPKGTVIGCCFGMPDKQQVVP
jgi:hypothetical protein